MNTTEMKPAQHSLGISSEHGLLLAVFVMVLVGVGSILLMAA